MSEERKVSIVYQRWVLIFPIILILTGFLFIYFWTLNPFLGLFGGALVLIGIMVLGTFLIIIASYSISVRSLRRPRPTPLPLSEEIKKTEVEHQTPERQDE